MSYVSALFYETWPRASHMKVNKYFLVHNSYLSNTVNMLTVQLLNKRSQEPLIL